MRVLIYEPIHDGHHMADLSRLLPGILELPVEVVLATVPEALEYEAYKTMVEPILGRTQVEPCCKLADGGVFRQNWHQFRECAAMVRRFQPDHLFMMMGDGKWLLAETLRLFGYRPWPKSVSADTYLVRGGFAYPDATRMQDRAKRWMFRRMLDNGSFNGLLLLDEQAADYAKQHESDRGRVRATLSPAPLVQRDPLSKTEARRQMGIPEPGRVILMIGMIQKLRGATRVMRAFARYLEEYSEGDERLVMAGPHDQDVLESLESDEFRELFQSGKILSFNRYLNDEEMFTFAAAADLATVGTHQHAGRSSVIVWVAANGRPVVVTNTGSIGWLVEREKLGWTCDVTDVEDYAKTLRDALAGPWTAEDEERSRAYASWHDVSNYRKIGTETLRRRIEESPKSE